MNLKILYAYPGDYVCTLDGVLMIAKTIVRISLWGEDEPFCTRTRYIDAYTASDSVTWAVIRIEEDDKVRGSQVWQQIYCTSSSRIDRSILIPIYLSSFRDKYISAERVLSSKVMNAHVDGSFVGYLPSVFYVDIESLMDEFTSSSLVRSMINTRLKEDLLKIAPHRKNHHTIEISRYDIHVCYFLARKKKQFYVYCNQYTHRGVYIRIVSHAIPAKIPIANARLVGSITHYISVPMIYRDISFLYVE